MFGDDLQLTFLLTGSRYQCLFGYDVPQLVDCIPSKNQRSRSTQLRVLERAANRSKNAFTYAYEFTEIQKKVKSQIFKKTNIK
jgi:hypothetical protein